MPNNFLSQLSPDWFASVMGSAPQSQGYADPMAVTPQAQATTMPDVGNLLQSLNVGGNTSAAPSAASEAPQAPRQRRSILDTVGRIADVLAKVGGADALYQPTLDARQDRTLALGDHAQTVDLNKLKLATAQGALGDADTARLGQAVRGVQAILAKNPQADLSKIWPLLAQQTGLSPERTAQIGQALAADPGLLNGLSSATNGDASKFGGSVVYGKDANGNLVAYQPGLGTEGSRSVLPEGIVPVDPLKFVDTGGAQVGVGTRSGNPVRILPKAVSPDAAMRDRTTRYVSDTGNATKITVAGMPARGKPGGAAPNANSLSVASKNIDELEQAYKDLNKAGGIVSTKNSTVSNVLARLGSSGVGQAVEGTVGSKAQTLRDRINSIRPGLMQSIAKATGMTGKQLDSNSDVKLFMQTVTDPSKSYEANMEAIAGLRRLIAENRPTASTSAAAARVPARAPVRPRAGKPSISNW